MRIFTLTISAGGSSQGNEAKKEVRGSQTEKKEVKQFLFASENILPTENPTEFTIKLKEIINEFSETIGFKINTWKLIVFLSIAMKNPKIKKRILFTE